METRGGNGDAPDPGGRSDVGGRSGDSAKTRADWFCLRMAAGAAGAAHAIRRWRKSCATREWRRCSSICSRRRKKSRMPIRAICDSISVC